MERSAPPTPTAARDVEITLLGDFAVHVDGRRVDERDFAGRRALQLVQLLALAEGHRMLTDHVIDCLWPQLDAAAGRANLRKAAFHARRALGIADAIILSGGAVRLCPHDRVSTDAATFAAHAAAAIAARDRERCTQLATSYCADLLPDARYDDWAAGPRDRLRELRRELLIVAEQWSGVVALDRTYEPAYQALMRQALADGQRTVAIRWFGLLREALAADLGVRPSAESVALYERCLEAILDGAVPMVGRQVELAEVTAVLRSPRCACIVVRGAAGMGKSSFCSEIARQAREDGYVVARTHAPTGGSGFGLVREIVEQLLVDAGDALEALDEHTRRVLAALTPAARPAAALTGPNSRHQVLGALRRLAMAVSRGRPVLLAVDDAHLVDDASLEVLLHASVSGPPLHVLVTCPPDRPHAVLDRELARLARAGAAVTVELGPLTADAVDELARRVAGDALPADQAGRIRELSEGNPLFVSELAHAARAGAGVSLTATIAEAITQRFADLDRAELATLTRVALAGREFDTTVAVALADGSDDRVHRALDAGLAIGLFDVIDGRFRFRHELVRLALLQRLAPHHRVAAHAAAARRLVAEAAPPGLIAHHWLSANRPTDAAEWLIRAARESFAVGAFANVRSIVALLVKHDPTHAEGLQLVAESMDAMGEVATIAAYDAAIAVARPDVVDDLRAKRALAQVKSGDPAGALRAIAGARPRSIEGRLCEALTYSGAAALGFGDPSIGTGKSAEVRRLALQSGDSAAIVVASWANAAAAHARGELRDSVLTDLRETKDLPHLAVRVFDGHLCITQRFLYGSRPYADVIAFAEGLADEAKRLGAARGHAFGTILRGEAELLSGQLDVAAASLKAGGQLHRSIGAPVGEALSLQRLAELALHRGELEQAESLIDEALDVARATDIGFHLFDRIFGTRIVLGLQRSPAEGLLAVDEAEASVRGPLETCPGCRITFAAPAGIACAVAGEVERAESFERATQYLADVVMRLPAWTASHDELRGHIAQAKGDAAAAAAAFAKAAAGFHAAGHPLDEARCQGLAANTRG